MGDKPDRLLSRQLRGMQAKRAIFQIKSSSGVLLTEPKEINACFLQFYKHLFTLKCNVPDSDITDFLDTMDIPKLSELILKAIKSFPNSKASGSDGFCIEFYKAHADIIAPLLLRTINHSFKNKLFPNSLYEANICLLLKKKNRDDTDPSSYRPLSLLNCDQKIVAKVLASRLSKHIASLIHPDQTGFILDRFSFSNVRRLLNVMHTVGSQRSKAAIISLDAEKAFDQIEWRYLYSVLNKFGFGKKILYIH